MPPVKPKPKPVVASQLRFVGRAQQIAQFRDSLRYTLNPLTAPPDRHYTHIFIAHGEGGMGKSTLLRRWCEVAIEEKVPAERVIVAQLDLNSSYPTVESLALFLRNAIAASFPNFDQQYQAARQRRAELQDRYDALHEEWQRYESLRDSGKLDELGRIERKNLVQTELQRAKAGALGETLGMLHQAEDSLGRLRSIDRFKSALGQPPAALAEVLRHEFGDDASLFDGEQWRVASFGADVCALAEATDAAAPLLVLAIDTYELADQHDDWLRDFLLEAGDHVLTLIGGRNNLAQRDGFQRRFADDLRTYVQTFDLGRETLNASEMRQLLQLTLEREPSDAELAEVERISRGVPLAVELLASEIKSNQNLAAYRTLQTQALGRNEVIRVVTQRFLSYVSEQQDDQSEQGQRRQGERLRIQALALPAQPDEALMCALWSVDEQEVQRINRELRAAHSFVFAGERDYAMHDLVREFVRADLWRAQPAGWLQLCGRIDQARLVLQAQLARWDTDPPEARFDDPDWRGALLNALNFALWRKDYPVARQLLLNSWIAARYYNKRMAKELENLLRELTPPTNEWSTLASAITASHKPKWYNRDRRDYAALKPYLGQLSPHAHMLWYVLQGQQAEPASRYLRDEDDVEGVQKSIAFHQQAFEMQPDWQPGREKLARLHRSLGDYARDEQKQWQQAIEHYNSALTYAANDPDIFFGRAYVYDELKNYPATIADLDCAIALNPEYAIAYNNRGNAKAAIADYDRAITDYDRAIAFNPAYALAHYNRGNAKATLSNYPAAITDYERAITLNPEYALAYTNRGNAKANLGDYPAAITDYDRAITLNPDDAFAYTNRGNVKLKLGDYPAALADYDRAITLNPEFALAYNNRGAAKANIGDYPAALADYDLALAFNPQDALAYANRGVAKIHLQDRVGAQADCERALQINPNYFSAMYNLACAYGLQNNADSAVEWLAQSIAGDEKYREMARTDSDFDAIRSDPRFVALVGERD